MSSQTYMVGGGNRDLNAVCQVVFLGRPWEKILPYLVPAPLMPRRAQHLNLPSPLARRNHSILLALCFEYEIAAGSRQQALEQQKLSTKEKITQPTAEISYGAC